MNHITMRGSAASVRWGYHHAADLGSWSIDAGRLSAQVKSHDAVKLAQHPLTFVVSRPSGAKWVWRLDDASHADGVLTGRIVSETTT